MPGIVLASRPFSKKGEVEDELHLASQPGGEVVSRRPRVPGTAAAVWRREVACGIDPTRALVHALRELPVHGGQVWSLGVGHDDGCPAIDTGPKAACTCEIVRLEARRAA